MYIIGRGRRRRRRRDKLTAYFSNPQKQQRHHPRLPQSNLRPPRSLSRPLRRSRRTLAPRPAGRNDSCERNRPHRTQSLRRRSSPPRHHQSRLPDPRQPRPGSDCSRGENFRIVAGCDYCDEAWIARELGAGECGAGESEYG